MEDIKKRKLTLLLIKNLYITERIITKKKKTRKAPKNISSPWRWMTPSFIGFNDNLFLLSLIAFPVLSPQNLIFCGAFLTHFPTEFRDCYQRQISCPLSKLSNTFVCRNWIFAEEVMAKILDGCRFVFPILSQNPVFCSAFLTHFPTEFGDLIIGDKFLVL